MGQHNSRIGESKYQKLKNYARSTKRPTMSVVDQYAYTGFLRRMAESQWADFFSLKGALMLLVLTGENIRPTKDIDLDGPENMDIEDLKAAIKEIMEIELEEDDGITFDTSKIDVLKDRTEGLISGAKVRFDAQVGTSKVKVNIDVGFENAITPEIRNVTLPAQLKDEAPVRLQMYPVETSISEKFRAMIHYGTSNSRLKDFYDIAKFAELCEFSAEELALALERSCEKFGFDVPKLEEIVALNPQNKDIFSPQWAAFLKKDNLQADGFEIAQDRVRALMGPVVDFINDDGPNPGRWNPETQSWEPEDLSFTL